MGRLVRASTLALAAGCAAPPPVIDAHVHLNDVAMQLALMEAHGIERAVVFWGRKSDNAAVAEAAARHPGRFIPFASVSPERRAYRALWEADDPRILAELSALLESGRYRGIGEISVVHDASAGFAATAFSPVSPTMRGIMALARRHRVPVLVHCERSHALELSRLLADFGDVPVIWAHGGYTGADEAAGLLARHANLHYELSARTWPRHPRSPDYPIVAADGRLREAWRELIERMPHRFLVGTDASHHSADSERMKHESVRAFLEQLSPPARAAVASGTLRRILGER